MMMILALLDLWCAALLALALAAAAIIIIRLFLTQRVTSWVDFWVCMSSSEIGERAGCAGGGGG